MSNFNALDGAIENLAGPHIDESVNLNAGIAVAIEVLSLLGIGDGLTAESIVDEGLLKLPNSERQDPWFQQHPWMRGERAAFEVRDSETLPLQAKFYWLKKKGSSFVAGGVHFTKNWEDHDFTRTDEFKVGLDFFLSPDGKTILVVLSNKGNLRVMELSGRLSNTQMEVFDRWVMLSNVGERELLHAGLWESFKLQTVNKKFYDGVSGAFNELFMHLRSQGRGEEVAKLFSSRLLGRLIFVWFLRKKGLVSHTGGYFEVSGLGQSDYYHSKLERLFFLTLNTPINERSAKSGQADFETPYLNGGLFAPQESDWPFDETVTFPPAFFDRLFDHFESFNFTTDESTPEYEQVAIDPEMLGRVFESLLASQTAETGEVARKASGAFYTPREIVSFMCKEALRARLLQPGRDDVRLEKAVTKLLDTSEHDWAIAGTNSLRDIPGDIRDLLVEALKNIKVIDPACGSGAFPMGMLQLLVKLLNRLEPSKDQYTRKLQIIENSIFGVDLEPMAVEISRLRAWLTLVVDEKADAGVQPLPNLDFKFVCANSLMQLEKVEEYFDLFHDVEGEVQLSRIRHDYFLATSASEKIELRGKYLRLANSSDRGFDSQRSSQLKSFNPFEFSGPAQFFDTEIMFGVSEGFDVVIGNPPYIDYRKIDGKTKKSISKFKVASTSKMINLYLYFFELGFDLLSQVGVLAYITPQQYLSYPKAKGLRELIRARNLVMLADFARAKVFDAATYTFTSIVAAKKSTAEGRYLEFGEVSDLSRPLRELAIQNPVSEPLNLSPYESLCTYIENVSDSKLGDAATIFCASSSTTLEFSDDVPSEPRFLAASDIHEWRIREISKRVVASSYPRISALKQQVQAVYTSRMTNTIRATVVEPGQYLGGKVNVLIPNAGVSTYLLAAILNSKVVNFWYREKFAMQHMQGGALPVNTTDLEIVPLPQNSEVWEELELLSQQASHETASLTELRNRMDDLIFGLFKLSSADKEIIEKRYLEYLSTKQVG